MLDGFGVLLFLGLTWNCCTRISGSDPRNLLFKLDFPVESTAHQALQITDVIRMSCFVNEELEDQEGEMT